MVEPFSRIYARILDGSGVRVDTGKYLRTNTFIQQLKGCGDTTLDQPANDPRQRKNFRERLQRLWEIGIENVSLCYPPQPEWTFNPFGTILCADNDGYRRRLQRISTLPPYEGKDKELQKLEAERQRLMPQSLISELQNRYSMFMNIPEQLREKLVEVTLNRFSRERKDLPEIGDITDGLNTFLKRGKFKGLRLSASVRQYTCELVEGLAEHVPRESYQDFVRAFGNLYYRYNPEGVERFHAQVDTLLGIEIGLVPEEWGGRKFERGYCLARVR